MLRRATRLYAVTTALAFVRVASGQAHLPSAGSEGERAAPEQAGVPSTDVEAAGEARKAEIEQAVAIRLEGDREGCPSSADFFDRLQQRAPGVRLTRPGEPGWSFVARLTRIDAALVRGHLRVNDLDGGVLEREVSGASCGEVAEALTLIGAVTIRPGIAVDYRRGAPTRDALSYPMSPFPLAPSTAQTPAWSFLLRGVVSMRSQVLPVPLYAMGFGAELARQGTSVWRPALGIATAATLAATANTDQVLDGSELTGQLIFGQLSASPAALQAGALELRPYGTLELGSLAVSGHGAGLAVEHQSREWWVAVALLLQAEVLLGGAWRVGAHAGVQLHPVRYDFQITPFDVYRTDLAGLCAGASISFRLN